MAPSLSDETRHEPAGARSGRSPPDEVDDLDQGIAKRYVVHIGEVIVQRGERIDEERVLVGPAPVDRRLADPGSSRDLLNRQRAHADVGHQLERRLDDGTIGNFAARAPWWPRGQRLFGHFASSCRGPVLQPVDVGLSFGTWIGMPRQEEEHHGGSGDEDSDDDDGDDVHRVDEGSVGGVDQRTSCASKNTSYQLAAHLVGRADRVGRCRCS